MVWRQLKGMLSPERVIAEDVEEELRFHIEEKVGELVRDGWSEDRARREVMRRFGDYTTVEAACRKYSRQRVEPRGWTTMMDSLGQDARLAFRTLVKNWGFSTVVAVTLALGIGATTAIFSIVNGVLLAPLPYHDADDLTVVWQNDRATGTIRENASTADYFDFVERSRSFESLAMVGQGAGNLTRGDDEPHWLNSAVVTPQPGRRAGRQPPAGERDLRGGRRARAALRSSC